MGIRDASYFPDIAGIVQEAEVERGWTEEREAKISGILAEAREAGREFFEKDRTLRSPAVGRPASRVEFSVDIPGEGSGEPMTMGLAVDSDGTLYAASYEGQPITPRHVAAAMGGWEQAAAANAALLDAIVCGMHRRLLDDAKRYQI